MFGERDECLALGAVFTGEIVDIREALLQFAQAPRVQVQAVTVMAQLGGGLPCLDQGALEQLGAFGDAAVEAFHFAQFGEGAAHEIHRGLIVFIQQLFRLLAAFEQAAGVGEAPVFLFHLGDLSGLEIQGLKFGQLEAQQLQARLALALRGGETGVLVFQGFPLAIASAQLRDVGTEARVFVEQLTLGIALEQRLMGVLAMDVHQALAQFTK